MSALSLDPQRLVGNDAGWHLVFAVANPGGSFGTRVLSRGRADYYAAIDAALPGGLDAGAYTFTIEGVTDDDYKTLADHHGNLVVKLYLYWRDTSSIAGRAASLAGLTDTVDQFAREPDERSLVSVLKVTRLSRRAGARRYEVVVDAREWVYDRLTNRLWTDLPQKIGPLATARIVAEELVGKNGVVRAYAELPPDDSSADVPAEKKRPIERGHTGLELLSDLGVAMENQAQRNRFGLGMYLIRDGVLHMGSGRLVAGGVPKDLTPDNGLIEIQRNGTVNTDTTFNPLTAGPNAKAPSRDLFEITMKGRPDLKPGDFVTIALPREDMPLESRSQLLYVTGVTHRLSRIVGFVTTVSGISTADRDGTWYAHSADSRSEPSREIDGSPDAQAAGAVRRLIRGGAGRRFLEVGQVRAIHSAGDEPPPQTETIWRSLGTDDGDMYAATRVAFVDDASVEFSAMPYATPFAWGSCGLILPRYPGMRVLVEHRNGASSDPIDIGALWDWRRAPQSNPGDYWLILPASIPDDQRASLDENATPANPVGKATNDLTDADGNRVIEVGQLTIRVGTDLLNDAGTRPEIADSTIHIEHAKGSTITIDQDGNVSIKSAADLTLSAAGKMTLDASAIAVTVSSSMDVSRK